MIDNIALPIAHFQTEAIYRSYRPPEALTPFIKEFWIMDIERHPHHTKLELQQPQLFVEFIFKYGQDYIEFYPQSGLSKVQTNSNLFGIRTFPKASRRTSYNAALFMIGIKFTHAGAYKLLGFPLDLIKDRTISIQDLDNQVLLQLEDILADIRTDNEILFTLNSVFELCFISAPAVLLPESEAYFLSSLNSNDMEKLRKLYNYKYIERKFKKFIGITPKKYYNFKRYLRFFYRLIKSDTASYINIMDSETYYDQNHLIKEFKKINGISPTKFLASASTKYTQHISQHLPRDLNI